MAVLDQLIETHGEELALWFAGTDGVACRMLNTVWMAVLTSSSKRTVRSGRCGLRLAGHDGVACRMLNTVWMAVFDQLIETHGEERALRLAGHDGVACRMLNTVWMAVLDQRIEMAMIA
jgi:hypothetical protein